MSVLLHLSDTHFGTERPQVVEALVALAAREQPELAVLSGDITQRARPGQFRAAKAFVERLGAPVLAVPGNHDIALFDLWSRALRPFARYASAFGPELEPVFASRDLLVIGVNTTRAWRHKEGEVSRTQIDRVTRLLHKARAQQLRVVVVHHPPAVCRPQDRTHLLRGHHSALRAWSAAGADLVLGGHIHLPYTLAPPGLARRLWVVQAGTAVSARTRPGFPNSVNIVRWDGASATCGAGAAGEDAGRGDCFIERWDYAPDARAFVRAALARLTPERA